MLGLFWKKTTNKAAIIGALVSIPIAFVFKATDMPWMDQMGLTAVLTMVVIIIVSLIQHKGKDDDKAIQISKELFKTSPLFNIGAFAVMLIVTALYAMFWN